MRHLAVASLAQLCDAELVQYMLQLAQVLKHETSLIGPHSSLGKLLMYRALRNP